MRAFFLSAALGAAALAACGQSEEPVAASADAVKAAELPLTVDTTMLLRELVARGVRSKSDALALLPHAFKQRFVLVTETGALGMASRARPRIIHFAEDGRFIVASTGHGIDEDLTARSLEILAEDPVTKTYRTHTIEIDPVTGARLIEDDRRCTGCHGTPARPIWAAYPIWLGTYGAVENEMEPAEKADFEAFVAMAKTDPDYRHLEIHPTPAGFYLPTPYGYANTLFGKVLGKRYAAQLAARIAASPNLPRLEYVLAGHTFDCRMSPAVEAFVTRMYNARFATDATAQQYPARTLNTKIYRLLGVEPAVDLRVDAPVSSPPTGDYEVGYDPWDAGGDYLHNEVELPLFAGLVARDPALARFYGGQRATLDAMKRLIVDATSTELIAYSDATSPSYYEAMIPQIYRYVHGPIADTDAKKAAICSYLESAQLARQQ